MSRQVSRKVGVEVRRVQGGPAWVATGVTVAGLIGVGVGPSAVAEGVVGASSGVATSVGSTVGTTVEVWA